MIAFEASLFSGSGQNGVSMDSKCQTFTIQDYSNYTTNTEGTGFAITDFSQYRVIVITHQSGNSVTLSTFGTAPFLIPAPSTGSQVFTTPVFNGDGVYYFDLYTVPTWNSGASYLANVHCVYYNGQLYLCIQNCTDVIPQASTLSYWQPITQAQLTSKYFDEAYVGVACTIKTCMDAAVQNAICNFTCNTLDLCKNPCFLNANKLTLLYYNIQASLSSGNVTSAENSFDLATTICANCNCSPC